MTEENEGNGVFEESAKNRSETKCGWWALYGLLPPCALFLAEWAPVFRFGT
jgi:hypothetical protein